LDRARSIENHSREDLVFLCIADDNRRLNKNDEKVVTILGTSHASSLFIDAASDLQSTLQKLRNMMKRNVWIK
jgi:hypothetical protein